MSELDNTIIDNHIDGEQVETVATHPVVENAGGEQTPQDTQQEAFLRVKYNKEERALSQEEAQEYAQKGLNYDKVNTRLEQMNAYNERLAKLGGYQTADEMFAAIEEAEKAQRQEQFGQYGLDEEAFNKLVMNSPLASDLQFAKEMKQQQESQQFINQQVDELLTEFPDLTPESVPEAVWEMAQSRNVSLLDAYLRVNYKNLNQQAEQSAIQKLKENATGSPGSLAQGGQQQTKSISKMSKDEFKAFQAKVMTGELRG